MKLATLYFGGCAHVVRVDATGQHYWPVRELAPELPAAASSDMTALIEALSRGVQLAEPRGPGEVFDGSTLAAPLPRPPHNIMCVGKNYYAHAREFASSGYDSSSTSAADAIPKAPIIFTKPSSSISGPSADIPLVAGLDNAVDYEAELAVVVGRGGRCIPADEAMSHVFGYTVVNDVTARDLQGQHKQWFLGKGIDGFCPMGPWIVSADELDVRTMRVTCHVNGEKRQDATTADLIFDIPTLIAAISLSVTLVPGDVIATGTPEGVGIGFKPARFLREGDVVECAIEGIGRIRNTVRRVDPAALRAAPAI